MNNELKFIMLNDFASYMSKDRVLINSFTTYEHDYKHTVPVTLNILIKKSDFNPNDVFIRIDDTESYQLRPKAIYKNNKKKLFYKNDGYKYLTREETIEAENYIKKVYDLIEALNEPLIEPSENEGWV